MENYTAPKNEMEQKICAIYAEIFNVDAAKIGVNDSFFKLGGNSILSIHLVFKLQSYFDITVNDIFEYKTPAKLAQLTPVNNINLVGKLEQIKMMCSSLTLDKDANNAIEHEHAQYKQYVKSFVLDNKIKSNSVVLLTGASGYLGCHLLYELLTTTDHFIYLPIRANSKETSCIKLYNKFRHYFDTDLHVYRERIKVFSSDLSKINLGLDTLQYKELINTVDSIIHSAALVKHYGTNTEFYLENVQATINLLDMAKLTTNKDFHYISTIGVFTNTSLVDSSYNIFIEESINDDQANLANLYTRTKYQGEQFALKYREHGVKTNVYRVGNLAINSKTHKTQENIEDNAFFQRVKTILKLGVIPPEISESEISPVDCTARAVVLLFNQSELYDQVFHVFNPQKCSLHKLFGKRGTANIKQVPFSTFIDFIATELKNSDNIHQIELYILHQWGLYPNTNRLAQPIVFQDKTNYMLKQLNFNWPCITRKMLSDIT